MGGSEWHIALRVTFSSSSMTLPSNEPKAIVTVGSAQLHPRLPTYVKMHQYCSTGTGSRHCGACLLYYHVSYITLYSIVPRARAHRSEARAYY